MNYVDYVDVVYHSVVVGEHMVKSKIGKYDRWPTYNISFAIGLRGFADLKVNMVSEKKTLIEIYDQGALIHVGQLIVFFVKRRSPVNMQWNAFPHRQR